MAAVSHIIGLRDSDLVVDDCEAPNTSVYYCLVCGPIIRETWSYGTVTFHRPVLHTIGMNDEETLQGTRRCRLLSCLTSSSRSRTGAPQAPTSTSL